MPTLTRRRKRTKIKERFDHLQKCR